MMVNRLVAIIVILFANVMLLANIAIPHHHHESEICIVGSHCDFDDHSQNSEADDHHHNHSTNTNSDHCALNQVYIIPADNIKQDFVNILFSCNKNQFPSILALIFNEEARDITPVINNRHLFFNHYAYFEYIVESKGLRGPPLV
jgi:uncharacterized protein DUF6769